MIGMLTGRVIDKDFSTCLLDVGGVGYEVAIPLSTFDKLPLNEEKVTLFIHTQVREDAITLFGFADKAEKELFRQLISVSGVGGKLALNVLSAMPAGNFCAAVASGDAKTVTEEDLINIIETIEDEGVLEPEQQELLNSALEFREKIAADIMIPIEKVVSVSSSTPLQAIAELLKTSQYSRLPVYEGSEDNIVGILPASLFLSNYVAEKPIVLRKLLLKPYVFDSQTEIPVLLQRMRLNKLHMVFVTDETKAKVGIITMEDLLEELVGDIQDESDTGEGLHLQ